MDGDYTAKMSARIRELNRKKYSAKQIAKELDISKSYLWKIIKLSKVKLVNNSLLYRMAGYNTKKEFLEILRELYDKPMTVEQVANHLHLNYRALSAFLKRNKFIIRSNSEAIGAIQKDIELTQREEEVINGLLLGDGHIESEPHSKKNYTAFICYTCKYKSVLIELSKQLIRLKPNVLKKTYRYKNGVVRYGYRLRMNSYKSFLQLKQKWYPNGIKIVPRDIKLTPETCYWWYLGDGSSHRRGMTLCTHSFTEGDVDFLIANLPMEAMRRYVTNYVKGNKSYGKKYPVIKIYKKEERNKFLEYIGPCRHPIYLYKWDIKQK